MATATAGTPTFRRMKELAATNPAVAARVELIQHRVLEEAFDVVGDPDAVRNLINDPASQAEINRLRASLETWMKRTGGPMLPVFQQRDNGGVRETFMAQQAQESRSAANKGRAGMQRNWMKAIIA